MAVSKFTSKAINAAAIIAFLVCQNLALAQSSSNWLPGKEYRNFESGSCTEKGDVICISNDQYKSICDQASGISKQVISLLEIQKGDPIGSVFKNGTLENVQIVWLPKANGCAAKLEASGIFRGTSSRQSVVGRVCCFIVTDSGKILAHQLEF